jgi:predicted lysophospholipase L1 biosynthesis ABC-type transport system permease subunit
MPQRVAANVAVVRRIRQFADADAVQYDPDHSLEVRVAVAQVCFSRAQIYHMGKCRAVRCSDSASQERSVRPPLILSNSVASQRFSMILLGGFALLALILASVGIYGVVSYLVAQRTNEIGIRMALGAQRGDVLKMIVGQGAKMALLGVAFGIAAALALTRLMSGMLFGVTPTDPLTFFAVAALLVAVALLACYIPARRASRVDPVVALRYE